MTLLVLKSSILYTYPIGTMQLTMTKHMAGSTYIFFQLFALHTWRGPWWAETVDCEPPTYRVRGMVKGGVREALKWVPQMPQLHSRRANTQPLTKCWHSFYNTDIYNCFTRYIKMGGNYFLGPIILGVNNPTVRYCTFWPDKCAWAKLVRLITCILQITLCNSSLAQ
jgi:hypothetical protein